MATLLHVFAHPKPEKSLTMRIANAFVDSYREAHPGDTIETFDLYTDEVCHLDAANLEAMMMEGDLKKMSPAAAEKWGGTQAKVEQLLRADRLLITAPMWNNGVPSIMKAYVDHVVLAGYTFRFTGPGSSVGMLAGRPLAIVSSAGGVYSRPPMAKYEMCVSYLRHIFEFLGCETVAELVAEGLALAAPHEQDEIVEPIIAQAREVARTFGDQAEMRKAA
ncbi:MAG: FMN-dependent NADH-azoreductase [Armatimonadota bacterium]